MRTGTIGLFSLAYAIAAAINGCATYAQSSASIHDQPELAVAYNYGHSNAPAGECGCFSLNGGSVSAAFPLRGGLSVVSDISTTHAGTVSSSGQDLTLSTFTVGALYSLPHTHMPLRPFGEVLVGAAHASGSLVQATSTSAGNSGAAFASLVGGGLDLRTTHRLSIRLIEADYLVTTFDNGSSNHQNSLRIASGLVLRF